MASKGGKANNYHDSDERKANIQGLFDQWREGYLRNREEEKEKKETMNEPYETDQELMGLGKEIAKLPLVNNAESVLVALYLYKQGKLLQAEAATDHHHAANSPVYKKLTTQIQAHSLYLA